MKKSKKSKLRFDTQQNARSSRFRRFVAAFSCFFILLTSVSVLLLLRHYNFDLSEMVKPADEQNTEEEAPSEPAPEVQGIHNYLLFCTADSDNTVRFISIVTADLNHKELSITALDPTTSVSVSGCTGTFSKQLDYGTAQLVLAAEDYSGIKIDKYVRSTDSKFKSIINYVGGVEVDVEQQIDIRTPELTAVIAKGKQTMAGDTMLKYIRSFESNPQKQAEIIASIIEQKLTPANLANADNHYTKIINLTESDISVVNFTDMQQGIKALLYGHNSVTVTVK